MIEYDDGRTQAPTVSLSPTETSSPTWAPSDGFPCPTVAPGPDIPEAATNDPDLSIFVELIVGLGLAGALSSCGPFTVFAPTDAAFAEVIADVDNLEALDYDFLFALVSYHVVLFDVYLSSDITDGLVLPTAQGETIEFQVNGDNISVNEKGFVGTEILASNGVIHKIDGVMFPDSLIGTSPPTFTPFTYSPSSTPSPTPSFTLPPAATYVPIDDDGTPPPTEIKFGLCGGALIAPDIILTAAHCSPRKCSVVCDYCMQSIDPPQHVLKSLT